MKCFVIVLLAVLAVGQSRSVVVDDQDIVLHGTYGKEILISKPYGPYGHRYIEIIGNGYFPDKKIDISESVYPHGDEAGYQRGKRSSDVFAEIFSGVSGTLDVDTYKTLLKKVEKAVEKGDISSYLYNLLLNYDLFAPFVAEKHFTPYEKDSKYFGQYPYGQYYGKYPTGKYFGSEYPQYGQYGQFYGSFPYHKYSPYFGKQFGGEQEYYGPYNYNKQVPYKYESEYVPTKHQVESTVPHKYETEYHDPRKYEDPYYVPQQYQGPYHYGTQYYGNKFGSSYGKQFYGQEGKVVPHVGTEYEGRYTYPYYGKYVN